MLISPAHAAATDHAALVHRLGGGACLVPIPLPGPGGLLEVGELARLPVWSLHASARDGAAALRRLTRRAQLGILILRDPQRSFDAMALSIPPLHWAALGPDPAESLACRRLMRAARATRATPLEHAIACADALDIDAAGRQAFKLLRSLLTQAVEALPDRASRADRHAWTLVQLTRLLFLRFVESEGWLDGNPRFLAEAFDQCLVRRRDPTRHLLHPLFFGTLNRPAMLRSHGASRFGSIPFLNGGLFEPHAIEQLHPMRLPVEYWRDAFGALVDRIEVTLDVDESEGRVTPELLGRVFEGVMAPEERQQEGAFFTPPALVDAVLRAALTNHLSHRLGRGESEMARALEDPDPETSAALLDLTILDPAVGSGAFLVGALALLHGPGPRRATRVRHLVTRRLFGVDRHPDAVRLTELRLWLEVLRAMRGRPTHRLPPLPNLNAGIRAGDSLLDPLSGHRLAPATAARLAEHHRALGGARGPDKRALMRTTRELEREGIVAAMLEREDSLDARIADLISGGRGADLFGTSLRLSHKSAIALGHLRVTRRDLRRERRRIARDQSAAPFALTAAFAPAITRRGGFDLVVGNPPWVRAERLLEVTRRALASRYRWWKSAGAGWRHLPDLSVAFVERSHELLAPHGTMALLLPAKLATAGYARTCRSALATSTTIHHVADLTGDPCAGFDATTYPLAFIASRRQPVADHRVRLGLALEDEGAHQELWCDAGEWLLAPPRVQQLANRLAQAFAPLAQSVSLQLGLKTGANRAFLNPPEALAPWSRRALRGRDIRAFCARASTRLLWPADARGVPWPTLPPQLIRHLEPHRAVLTRRADLHDSRWWRLFRTMAATAPHRVAWGDLACRLEATVVSDPDDIPLNSCYVASLPTASAALGLAAWLNCSWVRAIARLRAEPAAGGAARFGARAVGAVPFPAAAAENPRLAEFAGQMTQPAAQDALDAFTAGILGLDHHDRALLAPLAAHRR
ncbi:MAG: hypothetical protein ABJC19_01675 [Gemmatimonadota bacterium]